MGAKSLSWQDIDSWQKLFGIELNAWECNVIHNASSAYVEQVHQSSKVDCPPPIRIVEQDQKQLAKHIKSLFR